MANSTNEYLFAIKPLVTPFGESKSDFEIARLIAKEWGREEAFSEGKTELEWVKEIYEDAVKKGRWLGYESMPSFDEFGRRDILDLTRSMRKNATLQTIRNSATTQWQIH